MPGKRAAFEEITQRPLSEISAAQFVEALLESGDLKYVGFFAEKKKVELELDPTIIQQIVLVNFRDLIRGEKKKVEYEVEDWKMMVERDRLDKLGDLINPPIDVDTIADKVAVRLRERGQIK